MRSALSAPVSASNASAVRATTTSPDVSVSSRWTIPGARARRAFDERDDHLVEALAVHGVRHGLLDLRHRGESTSQVGFERRRDDLDRLRVIEHDAELAVVAEAAVREVLGSDVHAAVGD